MAAYCHDCIGDPYAARNDMRGAAGTVLWDICEGCGYHAFDSGGIRVCEPDRIIDVAMMQRLLTVRPCARCEAKLAEAEPESKAVTPWTDQQLSRRNGWAAALAMVGDRHIRWAERRAAVIAATERELGPPGIVTVDEA